MPLREAGAGAEALCMADWVVPLLARATYGPTPYTVSLARQASSQAAWLEQQLNPAAMADPEGDAVGALYPELGWGVATGVDPDAIDLTVYVVSVLVLHLGLLVWETRSISFSLASPGLKPRKS